MKKASFSASFSLKQQDSQLNTLDNKDAAADQEKNMLKPKLFDINESFELIELRNDIKKIVDDICMGNDNCKQSQFTKINLECRKLKFNFIKPAIHSWILLDLKNEGKVSTIDVVEWIVDNIIVESNLIEEIETR